MRTRYIQCLGARKVGLLDIPDLLRGQCLTCDQIIKSFQLLRWGPFFLGLAEHAHDAIASASHDVAVGHRGYRPYRDCWMVYGLVALPIWSVERVLVCEKRVRQEEGTYLAIYATFGLLHRTLHHHSAVLIMYKRKTYEQRASELHPPQMSIL